MEFDPFIVREWGLVNGKTAPGWIQFLDESISSGIRFKVDPPLSEAGKEYAIYFILADKNRKPMEEKYSFTLKVSAFVADLSKYTDGKETDLDIIEVDQKLVTVVI